MDPIQTQPQQQLQQNSNKRLLIVAGLIIFIAAVGYGIWRFASQTVYIPPVIPQAQQPAQVPAAEDSTSAISNDLNTKTDLGNTDQEFKDIDQDLKSLQ